MNTSTLFEAKRGYTGPFPSIISGPLETPRGTPYLVAPGVITLSIPDTSLLQMAEFLGGFDEKLNFSDYLDDPVQLDAATELCKVAGQLCYMSFSPTHTGNKDAARYFGNIKTSKHGSVLEHANVSFLLYGISRSVTHEVVRHRAGFAYSMVSQRYVSGKTLRFVERPEYQGHALLHETFLHRIDRAAEEYATLTQRLIEMQQEGFLLLTSDERTDLRKRVQQAARSLLPNETETALVMTGNIRAWRHFIEMRASQHAEVEIRNLAVCIFLCLAHVAPLLFNDYSPQALPDGTWEVTTPYTKV